MNRPKLMRHAKDKVQARYWADPEFRRRLRKDTTSVLAEEAGWKFPNELRWTLVEADPHALYIVTQPDMKPELTIPFDLSRDTIQRIQTTPPHELEQVLPNSVGVVRLQNNENVSHLVLVRESQKDPDELSDSDLDAVAGGAGGPSKLVKGTAAAGAAGLGAGAGAAANQAITHCMIKNAPAGTFKKWSKKNFGETQKTAQDHADDQMTHEDDAQLDREMRQEGNIHDRDVDSHASKLEENSQATHGNDASAQHSGGEDTHGSSHEQAQSENSHHDTDQQTDHSASENQDSHTSPDTDSSGSGESTGDEILSDAEDVGEDAADLFSDMCCCCP